ncbi:hypothetical protein [Nocardioides sp. R-C-SC26]|uniref:hypothetical protein n=1 Tax=Nocardioides sp. R-C-SC26 TaxID=2870414 RepID=UPI001E5CA55D|nr:hypothetical protein [Nocardioides sp. R-C-SC26]
MTRTNDRTTSNWRRAAVATGLGLSLMLSGCSLFEKEDDAVVPPPQVKTEELVNSQFTRDGTFQSHIEARGVPGLDFVYTLYPTKATPRTNEWFPQGNKFFTFTLQAYDLDRGLRDPFKTKRLVYLDSVSVTSRTITVDGGPTQRPYKLDVVAKQATFDPEPLATRYGMLITSPKGAFELRNQRIGSMSDDTRGVELTFRAVVNIQVEAGKPRYVKRAIVQRVPIAIFESDTPTQVARIPINAN